MPNHAGPCLMHFLGAGGSLQDGIRPLASLTLTWTSSCNGGWWLKTSALGGRGLINCLYSRGLSQWKCPKDWQLHTHVHSKKSPQWNVSCSLIWWAALCPCAVEAPWCHHAPHTVHRSPQQVCLQSPRLLQALPSWSIGFCTGRVMCLGLAQSKFFTIVKKGKVKV